MDFIHFKKTGHSKDGYIGYLLQLPFLKVTKYWNYLEKLGTIIKKQKDLKALKKEMKQKSLDELMSDTGKTWNSEEVLAKFSALEFSEKSSILLQELWESAHPTIYEGSLSGEIFTMHRDTTKSSVYHSTFSQTLSFVRVMDSWS